MPVPRSYTPQEVARQVAASRASFLVGHASAADKLAATLRILGAELRTVVVGDQAGAGAGAGDQGRGFLRWADFLAASSGALPAQAEVDLEKDVAVLPFSSGTTGPPKVGAGQTHVSRLVLQTFHRFSQSQKAFSWFKAPLVVCLLAGDHRRAWLCPSGTWWRAATRSTATTRSSCWRRRGCSRRPPSPCCPCSTSTAST